MNEGNTRLFPSHLDKFMLLGCPSNILITDCTVSSSRVLVGKTATRKAVLILSHKLLPSGACD